MIYAMIDFIVSFIVKESICIGQSHNDKKIFLQIKLMENVLIKNNVRSFIYI